MPSKKTPGKSIPAPSEPDKIEVCLERLYFGKDDAESDIVRGGLLKQGFMRTRAYEEALTGGKTLIIGRKGSGKSAICLFLRDTLADEKRCVVITPDEISADEIRRFQLAGIPAEQSKQLIWRYVFAVQVAKFILSASQNTNERGSKIDEKLVAIRKFLLDNGELEDLTFSERFWKVIERLKGVISVEAFHVKVKAQRDIEAPSAGTKAHAHLDLVEAHLNSAAELLALSAAPNPFLLLVDQIEKVWSNDRESDSMVVGLLLAAKQVRKIFPFAICTVFLRTDIYEQLQFQDRDKFRGDEFHIDWDEENLLDLILARAQASIGKQISADNLWDTLFPGTIESQKCQKFLVGRTLMRPRDIIQLCNACRDTARNNRHSRVEESDVKKALAIYSTWKLNDLQNEWIVNYPFLADVFILLANSSYLFTRSTFEASLNLVKSDMSARYPSLRHVFSADTLLSVLYSIGLLGVVRHSKTCYAYAQNTERQIRSVDKEFVIHPSFRNSLQSTSAIKLTPFESQFDTNQRGVVSRFLREARHGNFEQLRAPRFQRGLSYAESRLSGLHVAIEKSSLPDELRSEVASNVITMRDEIRQSVEFSFDDPLLAQDVLSKLHRHLVQISRRLSESNWLTQDKELSYSFLSAIEELENIVYRGGLGEFRS